MRIYYSSERVTVWDLLVDPAGSGDRHMALDDALLRELDASSRLQTIVRLYRWNCATLSLGWNQPADEEIATRARLAGIDTVRRPTGGRAVLHGGDFTYSFITNDPTWVRLSVTTSYRTISIGLQAALRLLGVQAESGRSWAEGAPSRQLCFDSPLRHELCANGRKLLGSAQRRLSRALLQHGSLALDRSFYAGSRLLTDQSLQRFTCLSDLLEPVPDFEQLCAAFRQGLAETFGVDFRVRAGLQTSSKKPSHSQS